MLEIHDSSLSPATDATLQRRQLRCLVIRRVDIPAIAIGSGFNSVLIHRLSGSRTANYFITSMSFLISR